MQNSDFEAYVNRVRWKPNKHKDHAYHVVDWEPQLRSTFYAFCQFIRENGYHVRYRWYDYLCYDIGEYKYWTMYWPSDDGIEIPGHNRHYPLSETILINRNRIDGTGA